MLKLAEEPLNEIALAIDASADGTLDYSLAGGLASGLGIILKRLARSVHSFAVERCNRGME